MLAPHSATERASIVVRGCNCRLPAGEFRGEGARLLVAGWRPAASLDRRYHGSISGLVALTMLKICAAIRGPISATGVGIATAAGWPAVNTLGLARRARARLAHAFGRAINSANVFDEQGRCLVPPGSDRSSI